MPLSLQPKPVLNLDYLGGGRHSIIILTLFSTCTKRILSEYIQGDYLGEMTDAVADCRSSFYIVEFVSGGQKTYVNQVNFTNKHSLVDMKCTSGLTLYHCPA